MTMRERPPGENHEPEVVVDAPNDARGYNYSGWSVVRVVVWIVAGLMLLAGLLWLGQLFGLVAAVLPGGADPVSTGIWAGLGIVGLALMVFLWRAARGSRRAGR
jgi:hypothetical protein